ncbi:hypothetical protein [Chiayiivirga flava]|uniref:Uncharacterized protein n=1 Tax=Chiayiivirga flava TaxID=659595 RepID=A0A7W8D7N2_9GAMM|nr:hypothetical protein [Chiayiivirga flava]MBB5208171.1 hypothetical protein [Chiayiivirga flava]
MFAYRDFVPQDATRTFALTRRIEPMSAVLARAQQWVASENIDVINVETVLLPEGAVGERSGSDPQFTDNMQVSIGMFEVGTQRVQVIRVWFRLPMTAR